MPSALPVMSSVETVTLLRKVEASALKKYRSRWRVEDSLRPAMAMRISVVSAARLARSGSAVRMIAEVTLAMASVNVVDVFVCVCMCVFA